MKRAVTSSSRSHTRRSPSRSANAAFRARTIRVDVRALIQGDLQAPRSAWRVVHEGMMRLRADRKLELNRNSHISRHMKDKQNERAFYGATGSMAPAGKDSC
jgi:hypothetical protein